MSEFILEIGMEEMPARFVPKLADELAGLVAEYLEDGMVEFGKVETFATPRRLTAFVRDMALEQRREEEEVTGPPARVAYDKEGNLTKAGLGFAKSQGLEVGDLYTLETDKGEYLAAKKIVGGGRSMDILPELCQRAVSSLTFPKKMHWGSQEFTFGRPLRWFLALLDTDVVPFEVAGIKSDRITWGHRDMGSGPWKIEKADDYAVVIRDKGKVILDGAERRDLVIKEGNALAKKLGGEIVWKDSLLDEVVNLVEFPRPILGEISDIYLELPREVLLTSMEKHQKSFGVQGADGKLLPCFLTTLNIEPKDVALVRKGWERVLKARLEDARFFWEVDNKTKIDLWLDKLENVVFLGPLGSMGDKSRRLERLCGKIAGELPGLLPAQAADYALAGKLAKADLVSEMVNEFDSLQGIMGGIYAKRQGYSDEASQAVAEQYLPAGPDSPVPSTLAGAVLSMADKADSLAGCFGLNKIPTGANDPYALRRQALGICRIVMDHGLDLDVDRILSWAFEGYKDVKWKNSSEETLEKLHDFFGQRLRAFFAGRGYETRVVDAALGAGFSDIRTLVARIKALDAFSREDGFEQAVLTFKRAANIIRKQGGEAGGEISGNADPDLFEADQERALAEKLAATNPRFEELWAEDDFPGLFGLLAELRPFVDDFFDNVMVMCDDKALMLNRLNLLGGLVKQLSRLADFSALQV